MLPFLRQLHSPNSASRNGTKISLLVLHYTGMRSCEAALARLCNAQAQVSAHYVVDEDGQIYQLVEEAQCAWHAGLSFWRGMRNVNPHSIGIEIVNPGHEFGYRPFPPEQMREVARLSADIIMRHGIEKRNVVGHSDIAPQRKQDPGELFDWAFLAGRGVGAWPVLAAPAAHPPQPVMGDTEEKVLHMQEALAEYGYDIPQDGNFDEVTRNVVIAFQRHFRPQDIKGDWDAECAALLRALKGL